MIGEIAAAAAAVVGGYILIALAWKTTWWLPWR